MKVDAEAAGLDPRRLERIDAHLSGRYIQPGKIAGCQVAVVRHGQLGYFRSFGQMDRERSKPVGDDTIWRIYSMTKPITGVALLSLYEEGHFQLDDPVHRFIPDWKDQKVEEKGPGGSPRLVDPQRPMSVKDLLMHTSGLGLQAMTARRPEPGGGGDRPTGPPEGLTLESLSARLAELPLAFHPGTHWLYTVSTDICARLVEIISGRPFDQYLQERVFEPLGMHDTGFTVPEDNVERFSANYRRNSKRELVLAEDPRESSYLRPRSFLSGGGGLVSTTEDYLRFAQMLLNGGELDGVRILGRKTVELMTLNHLPGNAEMADFALPGSFGEIGFRGQGFGLTVAVGLGPARTGVIGSAGDYSWGGAASTIFWVDPAEELLVVFMTQLMPSGTFDFRSQLKTLVYPAIVD